MADVGPGLAAGIGASIGGMRRGLERGASPGLPSKCIRASDMFRSTGRGPAQTEPIRQGREASRNNRVFALEQKTRTD